MATVTAYAIHQIGLTREGNQKKWVVASTKDAPSVFEIDSETFEKLEANGAVRKATKQEIALSKLNNNEVVTNVSADTIEANSKAAAEADVKPASGAVGDPQGKPKAAKVKGAEGGEEI